MYLLIRKQQNENEQEQSLRVNWTDIKEVSLHWWVPKIQRKTRWSSTGFRRRLCLRLLWPWPLTFWPNQNVSGAGTYMTQFWWKYLRRYCIHLVFRVIACGDLDFWSRKIINTSTNPNTSVTKIGWNSLHWVVRYGVHKVFWALSTVTLTFDLLT